MTDRPDTGAPEESPKPRYTLRMVVKPLPSKRAAQEFKIPTDGGVRSGLRAENEDDDGYDPYSDYHDGNAGGVQFEADPWR